MTVESETFPRSGKRIVIPLLQKSPNNVVSLVKGKGLFCETVLIHRVRSPVLSLSTHLVSVTYLTEYRTVRVQIVVTIFYKLRRISFCFLWTGVNLLLSESGERWYVRTTPLQSPLHVFYKVTVPIRNFYEIIEHHYQSYVTVKIL